MFTFCDSCKKTHDVENFIPGHRYYCQTCRENGKTTEFHHDGRILTNDELDQLIAFLEQIKDQK